MKSELGYNGYVTPVNENPQACVPEVNSDYNKIILNIISRVSKNITEDSDRHESEVTSRELADRYEQGSLPGCDDSDYEVVKNYLLLKGFALSESSYRLRF